MEIFVDYGVAGMFVCAFIAGSVLPFSSEAVMTALLLAGVSPLSLFVWGTLGNIGGSMFNYGVGRMGRIEWVERYLHVSREKVESTQRFLEGRGAWMGVLCFLPILGSAIAVTLGFMRASLWRSLVSISVGKAVRYGVLILSVLGLVGCSDGGGTAVSGRHVVMVSIEPLRWAVEQVVDSTYEVRVLVPGGASPETYEPTAQDMLALSQTEYYFYTGGLGFELNTMDRLRAAAPHTRFVKVGNSNGTAACAAHGHRHGDPHVWCSPAGMRQIIDGMARALAVPGQYEATLRVDSAMRSVGSGTAFAIYHPSLGSLAGEYGWLQLPIEAEGKEPSPLQMARVIDRCRAEGVRVVFVQREFDRRSAEQVARQADARVVDINPLGYDWEAGMLRVAEALKKEE